MSKLRIVLAILLLIVIMAGGLVTYALPISASPALQQDPPTISVSGRIKYDTGSAHPPAQGLRVELRDDDPISHGPGELLAVTVTDGFGRYSFEDISNLDYDGPERRRAGGQDVRLVILTENDHVAVQSMQLQPYRWASDGSDLLGARGLYSDVPDGAHIEFPEIQFDDDVRDFQVIRAFVALNDGWSFVVEEMGLPDPGFTKARWPALARSDRGYDPERQIITLTTGDADFADAVLHLQAQAFIDNIYRGLSGAYAYPTQCTAEQPIDEVTSRTCAWVHGFGMFFAVAVQADPTYVTASEALNLESPLVELEEGDAVAARVAGALLDLMDANNEGFDKYTGAFTEIWNVFASRPLNSFPDFWGAWKDSGLPQCDPLTSLFQNTINYNTPPALDPFPDPVELDEDTELEPPFDMQARARDAECPFEKLLFDLEEPATSTVAVDLREGRFLHVIPTQDWHGEVTFNVRVFDGVDYATRPLHIVVQSINDPPRIAALPDRAVRVGEEIVYQLENSISDPDHPKESLVLSVETSQGALQPPLEWEIDQENFIIRFTPQDLSAGTNAIDVVVTDPTGDSGRHTLLLTWEPLPNEAPTIDPAMPQVWEAHKGQAIELDLLAYATDDRDEPSELSWSVDPETLDHATVSGTGTQKLVFTPDPADFIGDDEITLIVQDRDGKESTIDVILRWTPEPNIAPHINPQIPDYVTGMNQRLVVDLSPYGHDRDDNDAGLRWYVQFVDPEAPNLFVAGQGTQKLTFKPVVADFEGTIQVRFVVRDPKGAEASQVVNLTWQKYNVYMPLIMRPFQEKPTN